MGWEGKFRMLQHSAVRPWLTWEFMAYYVIILFSFYKGFQAAHAFSQGTRSIARTVP